MFCYMTGRQFYHVLLYDREAYDDEILVEAYRLHHSTSGQLYQLLEYNKSLRAVIQAVANVSTT
jgi:hypothetical protein